MLPRTAKPIPKMANISFSRRFSLSMTAKEFGLITQQAIRRCSFSNAKELIRKINAFVED